MKRFLKQLIIIAITAAISSTLTYGYIIYDNFFLEYIKQLVEKNYYGEVDVEKLKEGAATGMIEALGDNHSMYISSEYGFDTFADEIVGEFSGIGISIIATEENRTQIVNVYPDTPAEKVGIKSGDIIIEADGKDMEFAGITAIANTVRGQIGTEVNVKVKREEEVLSFDVKREKIIVPTVFSKELGNYQYIQVSSFDEKTDENFKKALESSSESEGVIIDLRNNTGGLLDTAVNMLDLIINEGMFIQTRYNDGELNYSASGKQIYTKPVVVLVNEFSASASEFFAAAVKENERGEIVGVNTYGKGSIQTTFKLPGNRGLHLTIGNFFSPKGNAINKVGVAPTYEVENPEEYAGKDITIIPFEEDLQLQKALEVIKAK